MSNGDKSASPPVNRGAALFFRTFWLISKVVIVLLCLVAIFALFGLQASSNFMLGIALSVAIFIVITIGTRLVLAFLRAIRGSG